LQEKMGSWAAAAVPDVVLESDAEIEVEAD
jgi:hypothetical protein